jgi:hypothetical protein
LLFLLLSERFDLERVISGSTKNLVRKRTSSVDSSN